MENINKICKNCIMDTTDSDITFDEEGVCNYCKEFDKLIGNEWFPNEEGRIRLQKILEKIKESGRNNQYDCIIGLSGGVDSSYLALKAKDWGLRPLVVHVDAGWNSELAVANIEKIVKHCNYNLHTHVVDWKEMRGLQLAYLRAGISNQDVPQDHIFFSSLYHFAVKYNIKHILSGGNISTEGIFPKSWHGSAMDAINLRAINKKYGGPKLKNYKTISFFEYYFWYPFIKGLRTVRPLNFLNYNKEEAINDLQNIGWRSYERKHGESIFTKFFQNYYLPIKFGYDKRIPHLSSLIVSGQLSREQALKVIKEPLFIESEIIVDKKYLAKKFNISIDEFENIINAEKHEFTDFPNWLRLQKKVKFAQSFFYKILGKKLTIYS